MTFWDRPDAGRRLVALAARFSSQAPVVVAVPRGGVPVAYEVASALAAPLELVLVRKIAAAGCATALGAVAEHGVFTLDDDAVRSGRVTRQDVEIAAQHEYGELMRRIAIYRGGRAMPRIAGRTVLVVDDGVASGNTARAAAGALRDLHPRRMVLLTPVICEATAAVLQADYDQILAAEEPVEPVTSLRPFYESFDEVDDVQALALLQRARRSFAPVESALAPAAARSATQRS